MLWKFDEKMAKREVQGLHELPWHELQDGTTPLGPAAAHSPQGSVLPTLFRAFNSDHV